MVAGSTEKSQMLSHLTLFSRCLKRGERQRCFAYHNKTSSLCNCSVDASLNFTINLCVPRWFIYLMQIHEN